MYNEGRGHWQAVLRGGTAFNIPDGQADFLRHGDEIYISIHANYTDCDVVKKAA